MGEVYLALDQRENRDICLKIFKRGISGSEREITDEFSLLTDFHHPSLITVYDYGIDREVGHYYTMEYISGGDLSTVIPLKPDDFFEAAFSLCAALDYIHGRGVIHGDLKPSNILRANEGGYKIADFGLSFIHKGLSPASSSGTAAFISPEVLRKESVSPRSDIYSLGLLFYEMIFGQPLYLGTAGEIIGRKLSGKNPSFKIPESHGGSDFESILKKMIGGIPEQRFRSAAEIADLIREFHSGKGNYSMVETAVPETGEFVGREAEIGWFEEGLESYDRQGFLYFIGGDSGVGKSRLLDQFRVRAQIKGIRFYKSVCREGNLKPLAPVLEILGYLFSELDPGMKLFSSYGPDLKKLFPEKYPDLTKAIWEPSDADIKSGRRRLFDNLLRYLDDLGGDQRIILAIEDLHWADTDTLDFLEFFGANSAAARKTFVVCSGRTSSEDSDLASLFDSVSRNVILEPADRDLWPEYLHGFLGQRDLPESFSDKLYEETGGNFLFAEEIIKELASEGFLVRRRGEWTVAGGWEHNIKIPPDITPLIDRRLDKLSIPQKKMAGIAAVLGRAFYDDEILELSGIPEGFEIIEDLIGSGVFKRAVAGLDEKVYFVHLQLKRAVEKSLPLEESARWHNRIADFYKARGEDEEFLGRHYALAGKHREGFDYLVAAAGKAERIFAYKQSSDLFKSARRCALELPESPERNKRLFTVNLGVGKALNYISPPDASEYLSRAARLAEEELADKSLASDALIAAGINSLHLGKNDAALDLLNSGLSLAVESNEVKLQGEACVGLGFVHDKMGKLDEANNAYLQALDLFAGIDFPEGSCRVLNYLGITRKRRGDLDGAEDFYRRALSICRERDFKWSAMNLYGNLGNLYSAKGDYRKAKEHYLLSLEISREISDRRIESVNLLNTGHIFNQLGEIDSAEKIFFEALEKQRALGDKSSEAITLNNLGFLYFRKGEIKNSLDYYQKGLDLSRVIDQPRVELANLIGIAEDRAAIADFNNALSVAEKASKLAGEINDIEQQAAIMPILAEVLYQLGEKQKAIDTLKMFFKLSPDIGESRQRIKALLLAELLAEENDFGRDIFSGIKDIVESESFLGAIAIRFRAESESLSEKSSLSAEIRLGRIDDAIWKAGHNHLHAEVIRLTAVKIRLLRKTEEPFEASRQEDRLSEKIARFTAGLDNDVKNNFVSFLELSESEKGEERSKMDKVNREERLEVLFRVARTINTIRESDPLLNKIMDLAVETLAAERGFIMLYISDDRSGSSDGNLEPVVARNLEREDILGEKTISRSSALEVAETGKPMLLSRTDDDLSGRQSVVDFRISSILCVPLTVKGKILGIVYIDSRSGAVFNDDDLEFLSSFADLAAIAIENARLTERLEEKTVYLQKQVESIWDFGNIIGRSSPMQRVFRMAESVADTDVNVVITGESGTGKELLARAVHYAGKRKNARFQPVDCGALTETLLESELFGYVKGAFTGAAADHAGLFEVAEGGAIFLDEVTNTSGNFQARLLRVLQENEIRRVGDTRTRPIDVRVIAASNKNLEDEVRAGNFREDLYYRLNVVNIHIPPLRERREDIPVLAGYFLKNICAKMKVPEKVFSSETIDKMMLYSWPGNVRQLENICERAVIFSKSDTIGPENLPPEIKSARSPADENALSSIPATKSELKAAKTEIDRIFIMGVLRKTGGNVMKAAALSGMDRSQLHHMINKLGLDTSSFKK